MSLANDRARTIAPTHPGEMLREDFMPDYGLSVAALAEAVGVSRQSINDLLRERRALSPPMALRLARLFGNSPRFWLQAQQAVDISRSEQDHRLALSRIRPVRAVSG
jgi:addiction module HigA family antidote